MSLKKFNIVETKPVTPGFSKYLVFQYILALLPVWLTAMSQANFVFAAATVKQRCIIPECESPPLSLSTPTWWPRAVEPRCSRPQRSDNCTLFSGQSEPCTQWLYENQHSIVSEFNFGCEEWKRTLVGTVHNVGVFISMPLMGYVADRWGRRTAIITSGVGLTMGALKTLTWGPGVAGYGAYLVIELLEAALATGVYTTAFVLMLELVGKDNRIMSSLFLGLTIAFGELTFALIVYLLPYWRHFQLVIYCPAVLFLSYLFLLEESLRWLLTNGKEEKAKKLVQKIEKIDMRVRDDAMEMAAVGEKGKESDVETETFSFTLIFTSRFLLKRLAICSWWWFSTAFVYYGLAINSVSLPGDRVLNFALAALASVPGDVIAVVALGRVGRKYTLCAGFLFCGACCVVNGFIPADNTTLKITIFLLGKAAIAVCFNCVYTYTSELVPTSARSSLVGACSMLARVGSVLAPLTPLLISVWPPLSTLLFGCSALLAGCLTLLLPDTLRRELPNTLRQAENIT